MGATKRFAELVTLDLRHAAFRPWSCASATSSAAAAASWRSCCGASSAAGRVPVTDPDATRFFMTGEEAASLVMKAAQIGEGGEVFWLDMGEPVRIGDLVDRLITLATPAGTPRVPVETIGLRPGEKMREELTNQGLEMKRTAHHRIWRARQQRRRAARGLSCAAVAGPGLCRGR